MAGWFHTVLLTKTGSLYTTGLNGAGQLGIGSNSNTTIFTQCKDVDNIQQNNSIIAISCGAYYTILLTVDFKIYATGSNQFGQFGNDSNTNTNIFTLCNYSDFINIQGDIKDISCGGGYHTAILTTLGYLYITGSNSFGQLGIGTTGDNKNIFTQCQNINNMQGKITDISCGVYHTALISNSQIYTTGYNASGQLGIDPELYGINVDRNIFTLCKDVDYMQSTNSIKALSCGSYHTSLLRTSLYIYTTGANTNGQLGIGTNSNTNIFTLCTYVDNIQGHTISIACGYYHTLSLTDSNVLYITGYNTYGQLGIGDNTNKNIFTLCKNGGFDTVQGTITFMSGGGLHTAILTNSNLYTTGRNNNGQLGIGSTTDTNVFTIVT